MATLHRVVSVLFCLVLLSLSAVKAAAQAPTTMPAVPVGLDAYREWSRWPQQRIGVRSYMRSTYDRDGLNRTADASHFLYADRPDFNVTLDVAGKGVLYFFRTNHWHGSPWHFEVDGIDHILRETSTATPNKPVANSTFEPAEIFPPPLAWTWSTTRGADLSWVPVPFDRSLRIAYERTFYGTGYWIYQQMVEGTPTTSQPRPFDLKASPDAEILRLIQQSGSDIAPRDLPQVTGSHRLEAGRPGLKVNLNGPRTIRALKFTLPKEQALAMSVARLRITWDDRKEPSVDAPLALFFGTGLFYNRENVEHLVKSFPMSVRYVEDRVELACYFPMPFFRSASIEVVAPEGFTTPVNVAYDIRHEPLRDRPTEVGYFHATYRDLGAGERGKDHILLDTRGIEGSDDWSGSFVGTSFIFTHRAELRTLEGDPRFFFDDAESPQAYGTGTEEWGGGGDYWGGRTMTLPFAGHPIGAPRAADAKSPEDLVHSAYRFLLADLFPFGKNARIQLEHGGANDMAEHYQTVAYWYGLPAASLVRSDELDIGDAESEKAHAYASPDATPPQIITSRYELGPDTDVSPPPAKPPADQPDFAEWTFNADAGTYSIYLRGRSEHPGLHSDASWLQFDGDIGTDRQAESYASPIGAGNWEDGAPPEQRYSWSSESPRRPPLKVTFDHAGPHRLRLFPREAGHRIDQIWLSKKELPLPFADANPRPRAADPAAKPNEIILDAAGAKTQGTVRLIDDAQASVGRALSIESSSPPQEKTLYPAHDEHVRYTRGSSEFTLKLRPDNRGVMLRRTLDYAVPNQRAQVFIADTSAAGTVPDWQPAGTWYTAGSNTFFHSFPRDELGAAAPVVMTSNRRFREEEFLLPLRLTSGRAAIRVRVFFDPVNRPILPGGPVPPSAWSEIHYAAYCWVEPDFKLEAAATIPSSTTTPTTK